MNLILLLLVVAFCSVFKITTWRVFCVGNGMMCSDIWHTYHEWYFEIVILILGERNLRQFWNITSGIYAKYHVQIMLLFVYTTTRNGFVIFRCRYFQLSWNTKALSQSNSRNFSCSSIKLRIVFSVLNCALSWIVKRVISARSLITEFVRRTYGLTLQWLGGINGTECSRFARNVSIT